MSQNFRETATFQALINCLILYFRAAQKSAPERFVLDQMDDKTKADGTHVERPEQNSV